MQPTPRCPDCGTAFELRDIDGTKEAAACTTCGTVSPLSECFAVKKSKQPGSGAAASDDDPSPPDGCRFTRTADGVELVCSIRNVFVAILISSVSLFCFYCFSRTVVKLPPAWMEVLHSNAGNLKPHGGGTTTPSQLFFGTLFTLAFFCGALLTLYGAATYWIGHYRVQIDAEWCNIFIVTGSIEKAIRIHRTDIRGIGGPESHLGGEGRSFCVVITDAKDHTFAADLRPHRRQWLFAQMQKALAL